MERVCQDRWLAASMPPKFWQPPVPLSSLSGQQVLWTICPLLMGCKGSDMIGEVLIC